MSKQNLEDHDKPKVSIRSSILSPHNEAVFELGKKMISDTLDVSRTFAQFMITITISSLPVYFALLKLAGFNEKNATPLQRIFATCPAILILISFFLFILAYFPKSTDFSLDVIEQVKHSHSSILRRRQRLIVWALGMFIFAVCISVLVILVFPIYVQ